MQFKLAGILLTAFLSLLVTRPAASHASNDTSQGQRSHIRAPIIGMVQFNQPEDDGFKALIFDNGDGFAFQSAAPNRVNTWKIHLSEPELKQMSALFETCGFFKIPPKLSSKQINVSQTGLFFASEDRYYEVKNQSIPNAMFDKIQERFAALIARKTRNAERVPITDLLYASDRYQATHDATSPKTRLVTNITSDFCRGLSARQDIDFHIAVKHFLPDRYIEDVDPSLVTRKAQ